MAEPTGTVLCWKKSRASATANCVEVAFINGTILVRDSREPTGPVISISLEEWASFLYGLRRQSANAGKTHFDRCPNRCLIGNSLVHGVMTREAQRPHQTVAGL